MLAGELLDALRDTVGADAVYAEPPVHLSGGFFTENHGFRLAGAAPPWDGPLVVRLFPWSAASDLARREATVQTTLVEQGYPAAAVLFFDDDARLDGRRFFVMVRLPGRSLIGGNRLRELATSGWSLMRRMVELTATAQASLHELDAAPLLERLGHAGAGLERSLHSLDTHVRAGAAGLRGGVDWLVANRPDPPEQHTICHGDLWGGNILAEGSRITGVLDWSTATVAEPAMDVACTAMSMCLAPIEAPRPVQRLAARAGTWMCERYVRAYQRQTGADLSAQPYYEALRCAGELSFVAAYRIAETKGDPHDLPRPTWDSIAPRMIDYFRDRTGVILELPPPAR